MLGTKRTNEFSIIKYDIYKIRDLPKDDFEYVFDIGANVGFFSLQARILFPQAKIVAVEADKTIFNTLVGNAKFLNIDTENIAIGNGKKLLFVTRGSPLDGLVSERDLLGLPSKEMNTYTLKYLFDKYECTKDKKYMIKLNCEGAERFFIGDPESEDILKNSKQISMMAHFRSKLTPFAVWPEWKELDKWLKSLLKDTHTITYYSSNKNLGKGYYLARHIQDCNNN